jgi:Bacteriocin-protection, YdeI or OmpD-Associated/Domain of unknown function (DUF1905)
MNERTVAEKDPDMSAISFTSRIQKIGPWTILRLPEDASARLPSRGQVAVKGLINRHAFQAVLEPDGRRGHWLKFDKRLKTALGVNEGNIVALEIEPDKDWPEPDIPKDFQTALADATDISELWKDITPMARWEWVRWVSAAKNPETRKRRIQVGISKLQSGKRRPCCFDLAACTDPDLSKNGRLVEMVYEL